MYLHFTATVFSFSLLPHVGSVFRPQFAGRCSKLKTLRLLRPWSASPTRLLGTKIAGYRAAFHRASVKFSPLGRSVDAIAPNKVTDGPVIEQPPAASRGYNLQPDCSIRARKQHAKSLLTSQRIINLRGELLPFTRDINLADRAPLEIRRIRDLWACTEKHTELIGKLRDWIGNGQRDRSMSLSIRTLHGGKIMNRQLIALMFDNLSRKFDKSI